MESKGSPVPSKPAKFAVYQNPTLSAALTATSLRPPPSSFLLLFSLSSVSALALLALSSRENSIIHAFKGNNVPENLTYMLACIVKIFMALICVGASTALVKAIGIKRNKTITSVAATAAPNGTKADACLSERQLRLLGVQAKPDRAVSLPSLKPSSNLLGSSAPSEPLFPVHLQATGPGRLSRLGSDNSIASISRSKSSPYRVSSGSQIPSIRSSPVADQLVSTPWSNKWGSPSKEIITEQELEHFLADVDKKITESAEKLATPTPPATRSGFGISSPSTISGSANTSGTTRTTPLRPVRMSPGSQKYSTPPKKGEGEIPSPMSMEEAIEAFEQLGIYPEIEEWRDRLRQWLYTVLLAPLLVKIENSHTKVIQAAAKLGITITVSPLGSDLSEATAPTLSPADRAKDWQPAFTPDEDGLLHQLRAHLMQALDASTQRSNQQQTPQATFLPVQDCVDSITEHQRLLALIKGELIKGLLPQSSIPAEYTVRRIKELAEGTCLKNYEYIHNEEASYKVKRKWTLELPTDSHLLLYLFCAFLEYPKWMLHVDPSTYSGAQSSKNPLFLGILPPKERFPEKYTAVISVVPSTLHPGACILVMGRQSPPVYALYCDKKLQFCLQGRTALWDSILLLCHRIKTAYGGFVRGIHLGSSALSILPVLESEED